MSLFSSIETDRRRNKEKTNGKVVMIREERNGGKNDSNDGIVFEEGKRCSFNQSIGHEKLLKGKSLIVVFSFSNLNISEGRNRNLDLTFFSISFSSYSFLKIIFSLSIRSEDENTIS